MKLRSRSGQFRQLHMACSSCALKIFQPIPQYHMQGPRTSDQAEPGGADRMEREIASS